MTELSECTVTEIRRLVKDLAEHRFAELEADGRAGRVTAEELKHTIDAYGMTITELPDEAIGLIEIYSVHGQPGLLLADVPLWTLQEGRSDLTLSVTIHQTETCSKVEINDISVM